MIPRMRARTALVTGVGLVNAIANDFDSFIEAMRAGRCGQRTITGFDASGLRNPRACEAADFDSSTVYEHRDGRGMDRSSELVLCAFDQAVAMARIDLHDVEPARGAVLMGSTLGGTVTGFRYYRALRCQFFHSLVGLARILCSRGYVSSGTCVALRPFPSPHTLHV